MKKIKDSPETEEEVRIRYLFEGITRPTKDLTVISTKVVKIDCNKCGAPNLLRQQKYLGKSTKCGKIGLFVNVAGGNRKTNYVKEEKTRSTGAEDWSPDTI